MARRHGRIILLFIILTLFSGQFITTFAQEEENRLDITKLKSDQFPSITLNVLVLDADGRVIRELEDFRLSEDGIDVEEFQIEPVEVGADVVFVIDANETISGIDQVGGISRLEKVKNSIIRYANFYMDPLHNDGISILVPSGPGSQFLDKTGMTYANEVINAANLYQPGQLSETPLQRMMVQALETAVINPEDGRSRSVVLFTDGSQLSEQLDYDSLTSMAQEAGVPIFGLLLGARADEDEVNNLNRLAEASGGAMKHMPEAESADALFEIVDERSTMEQVAYKSAISTSGNHEIEVSLDDTSAISVFDLEVSPPSVMVALDNSRPIRRVAAELDTPLELMEPLIQPLVAQVDWPDGYPRKLTAVSLLVNDEEVVIEAPILGTDGVLTFDWNLRHIDQGLYDLQIQVTDELGLQGSSPNVPLAVEVDRPPIPIPTATAAPAPTAPPATVTAFVEPEDVPNDLVILGAGLFFLAFFGLLLVLFIIFFSRRRSSSLAAAATGPASTAVAYPGDFDPHVTYVLAPELTAEDIDAAYLEALEHAPEHAAIIPIIGSNIALGRDPQVAQIPFNDRSVSRLHARIMESQGNYRIYDEGSSSGTYVNYERIGLAPRILNDNDEIHFGRVHLRFHLNKKSESNTETKIMDSGAG
jgi:hypothetical protein